MSGGLSTEASSLAATNGKWLCPWTDKLWNGHAEDTTPAKINDRSYSQGKAQSVMLRRTKDAREDSTLSLFLLFCCF